MGFLNSVFLIGLLAAGVPILIHLLTRDRVQRVAFSTLRFFANVSRSVLRRKRFREAILLAMRRWPCPIEVHHTPEQAWTDGAQSLDVDQFRSLTAGLQPFAKACAREV